MSWFPAVHERFGKIVLTEFNIDIERKMALPSGYEIDFTNQFVFRCDCGRAIAIWDDEMPRAKRTFMSRYPDCGCGIGRKTETAQPVREPGGAGGTEQRPQQLAQPLKPIGRVYKPVKVTITAAIDRDLADWIVDRAKTANQPLSRTIEEVLAVGVSALS